MNSGPLAFILIFMYKSIFNKRGTLRFKHFSNHGYSLFACLGREVLIGTLSVATLTYAKAGSVSTDVTKVTTDSTYRWQKTLEEVNITGSRAPLTQSQQARMVTVLSREDIQTAPVQSVNDLLKYAAGVDVRQRGAIGAQTDVSVRGGNYEQITILLNGINIGDPQTGHNAADFPVDISEIERIEVLEGPAGRVYGTSSLLGAINIVTKSEAHSGLTAHVEGGSYGYLSAGVGANVAGGPWRNRLSAGYARSDGYTRSAKGKLNTDYRRVKTFYQGSYVNEDLLVRWHAGMSLKDFGSSTFYSPKFDNQFEHTFKTYTAIQAETRRGRVHFRPSVYWHHQYDRFELLRGDDARTGKIPFNYHRTDVMGVNLNAYVDWSLGRTAVAAELRNEDLVSTNLGEKLHKARSIHGTDRVYAKGLNRTNTQFVLEHNVLLSRLTLSGGIIAVKNSWGERPMKVYPSLDASYRIGDGLKVFASYNTSLRIPSVTELYLKKDGHMADPNLKAEELRALEAGVRYTSDVVTASASVFHNYHTNLIDWISDGEKDDTGALVWKSVNFGHIRALGFETRLKLDMLRLVPSQRLVKELGVSYCFIDQDHNEPSGIQSLYALEYLKNKFVAHARLQLWRRLELNVNYRLQHRMGSYTDLEGQSHRYGTYGLLDAKLNWAADRWNVYLEGNNLTARKYVDVGNVPQPRAWIVAGAAVKLNF